MCSICGPALFNDNYCKAATLTRPRGNTIGVICGRQSQVLATKARNLTEFPTRICGEGSDQKIWNRSKTQEVEMSESYLQKLHLTYLTQYFVTFHNIYSFPSDSIYKGD